MDNPTAWQGPEADASGWELGGLQLVLRRGSCSFRPWNLRTWWGGVLAHHRVIFLGCLAVQSTQQFPGRGGAASQGRNLPGPIFRNQRSRKRRGCVSCCSSGHSPRTDAGPGPVGRDLQLAVSQGVGAGLRACPSRQTRCSPGGLPSRGVPPT